MVADRAPRSRREPEVPVYRVRGRITARRGLGKGKRELASSSSATGLRYLRADLMDPFRSPPPLDKYDNRHRALSIFLLSFGFGFSSSRNQNRQQLSDILETNWAKTKSMHGLSSTMIRIIHLLT